MTHALFLVLFSVVLFGAERAAMALRADYFIYKGDLKKATAVAPWNYKYLFLRSQAEMNHQNCDFAIETLKEILALAPNHWGAKNNLAICYLTKQRLDDAKMLWEEVLRQWPRHEAARRNLAQIGIMDNG